MGRKSRLKKERRESASQLPSTPESNDRIEMHQLVPAPPGVSAQEMQAKMTAEYQKQIKESPMWAHMVQEFGEEKAEELLKECKAEIQ